MNNKIDEIEIKQELKNIFSNKKIEIEFFENLSFSEWNSVLILLDYIPVNYTVSFLEYQKCYIKCFVEQFIDLSIVFYQNNKPFGIWPVSLKMQDNKCEFVTNEGPILKPLFVSGFLEKSKKHIYEGCLETLKCLSEFIYEKYNEIDINDKCIGQHLFLENNSDEWYKKCIEKANANYLSHELAVDLSMEYDAIKKNIRKSFRSLINLGERLWNITVYDSIGDKEFEEFRKLHYKVAGRITRSIETWELQKVAINKGEAFLIVLRDENEVVIGAGLFHISRDEGVYAVGAYDRELFDKPISHIVQMRAIQHMKDLGIKWYIIGTRFYQSDKREITQKEYNISYFKEGFATHMFLRVITEYPLITKQVFSKI